MAVSDLLEQPCNKSDNVNKVVTRCYQTACSKLVDNLGQAVRTQLVGRLSTRCEIKCLATYKEQNSNMKFVEIARAT
jgi:hypothetical protein